MISVIPSPPPTKIASINWFSVPSQERKRCILLIKTSSFLHRSSSAAALPAYESFGIQSNKLASVQTILFSENKRVLPVACSNLNDSEGSEKDDRALKAVLRLYRAIRQKNMDEVSDVIGDECRCISNFVYRFQPFHGKKVRILPIRKKTEQENCIHFLQYDCFSQSVFMNAFCSKY